MKLKRWLAAALCLCMLVGMMSLEAFAVDETVPAEDAAVVETEPAEAAAEPEAAVEEAAEAEAAAPADPEEPAVTAEAPAEEATSEEEAPAEEAAEEPAVERSLLSTVYVETEIPYATFYSFLRNSAEVDTVSSATTGKCRSCANVYFETEDTTISGGTDILGVVMPVRMTYGMALMLGVEDQIIDEPPAVYLIRTLSGRYVLVGDKSTVDGVDASLTSYSVWGDYQLMLTDSSMGKDPATVYGAYLTMDDGTQYALRQGENMWTPRNYYEFAWSTGVMTNEPHGGMLKSGHYASMEGKSIVSITYITTSGIETYELSSSLYVAPHYADADVSAEFTDSTTVSVSGIPEELEDVTVSIGTTGRGATYLVQNAEVVDGTVTLDAAAENGKTYTVFIYSSNYAVITTTVTYTAPVYVMMNIPYADFYAAENAGAQVDVISTATTNKCTGTTGLAKGTYNTGLIGEEGSQYVNILGVTYPVKMDADTYAALNSELTVNDDYYFTLCEEVPAAYKVLTIADDGSYQFSAVVGADKDSSGLSVTEFTTNGSYGDYQITLDGVKTAGTINGESATIAGVILETSDGETYALYMLNNMWLGTRVENVELAWSVVGGMELQRGHGAGPKFDEYDMMGKTLTSVKLITDIGVYTISCDQYLKNYYKEAITADAVTAQRVAISNLPEDIENATVSVYYVTVEGEGRNAKRTYTYAAQDAEIVDGVVVMDTALETGVTYTVLVKSDNYANITGETVFTAIDLADCTVTVNGRYIANGKKQVPDVVVVDPDGNVVDASNYTVSVVGSAVRPGTYQIVITAVDAEGSLYTGSVESSFTVESLYCAWLKDLSRWFSR